MLANTDPPPQDLIDRFMAARRADPNGYAAGDRLAMWTAQRREGWDLSVLVRVSNQLRAWHDLGRPTP